MRRAWARATIDSGVAAGPFRCPGVWSVTRVPAGDLLDVRVRRGQSVAELDARSEQLAACLRAREVRVLRDRRDAARASVLVVRRDPFEGAAPIAWPAADAEALSLWEPIPVGVDEQGERVAIELVERNVLIGGEPGAGKSAALSIAARRRRRSIPDARIWLLDGKLVELAAWAPVAQRVAGPNGEEAIELLREVRGGDGGALPRAARARAAQDPPRGRAAAAPGGLRRAGVLPDGAGEGACGRSSPSCCATWSPAAARPA